MVNRGITTPLVADIHFNPQLAVNAAEFVEKVRLILVTMPTRNDLK